MKTLALLPFLLLSSLQGQTVILPFASEGNTLELSVKNESPVEARSVTIEIMSIPSWITFSNGKESIPSLEGNSEKPITYTFSVDRTAPVGEEHRLVFAVSLPNGQSWRKEMVVSVAAPDKFELFQNYPNPFNAATVISYQLSVNSKVNLNVFNLIGQNVGSVIVGEKPPGYHQETWDALSLASGVYVYQLTVTDASHNQVVARKRMTLLK
ncbi:MAG TPA: T9SS type A sorting domain-containing protein [Bacteroidota bacterium]|nr:T9SS type A sorting domain-containing protein [Bacteroidota bacterium]